MTLRDVEPRLTTYTVQEIIATGDVVTHGEHADANYVAIYRNGMGTLPPDGPLRGSYRDIYEAAKR